MRKRILMLLLLSVFLIAAPIAAADEEECENARSQLSDEISDELERQLDELDLSAFESYFEDIESFTGEDIASLDEFLLHIAENGYDSTPDGTWGLIKRLAGEELRKSAGSIAALVAAALMTALSGIAGDNERPVLSLALSVTAITLASGVLALLCGTASDAVSSTGELTERAMPILTALLVSLGSAASAGIFRPLMLFLSGTVVKTIETFVLPLVLALGVLKIIDAVSERDRLDEFVKLTGKTIKWLLGLISVFYFAITAIQGLSVAARDGVALRTAKYALDRLVPVVGSMVSGTVDSVMGCALLIKNGVGIVTVIILLSLILRPLIVLGAGIFIFRASAALAQPVADKRVVKLFSGAAETVSYLFACTAAAGCMLAVTVLVFIAAGGVSAGLW